jgi:hypothetical protein
MMLQHVIISITSAILAIGFAGSQASAGTLPPACNFAIEVNALRGGSPFVTVGGTKDITAKARIRKGTAVDGTTVDTRLRIEAIDGLEVIDSQDSYPIRLGVGKGGQGDTLTLNIPQCNSGAIRFVARFQILDGESHSCDGTRTIAKTSR